MNQEPTSTNGLVTPEQLGPYGLPLYENKWSIFMELILLDALEMFGTENWAMISSYLNSSFSPEEVRDHYFRVYGDHSSEDPYKLKKDDSQFTMLIQHPEDDIYIAARKRQARRIAKEESEKRKTFGEYIPGMQITIPAPEPPSRIPQQFGYERSKKIFIQPYNQEAEVMIVGLKINKHDDKLTRENKMRVLQKYNELIVQRAIVENQVINKNLMECKYRIKKTEVIQKKQSQFLKKKTGQQRRRSGKNRKNLSQIKQSKYVGHQFFENMERTFDDDLSERLHFIYTKIKIYDQEGRLKKLLAEYEQKCRMIQNLGEDRMEE